MLNSGGYTEPKEDTEKKGFLSMLLALPRCSINTDPQFCSTCMRILHKPGVELKLSF